MVYELLPTQPFGKRCNEYLLHRFLIVCPQGAVTKQPLKSKKLLVDYMKSTNNFFVFPSKKGPEGPFSLV